MDESMARVGEADRKTAIQQVKDAYRDGLIIAADRDSRIAQLQAAHSRSEIDVITRDITNRAATRQTSADFHAAPPQAGYPQQPPGGYSQYPQPMATGPMPPVSSGSSSGRGIAVVGAAIAVLVAVVGAGLALFVMVDTDGESTGSGTAVELGPGEVAEGGDGEPVTESQFSDLLTPKGFTTMRERLVDTAGSARVLQATLYPDYALITLRNNGVPRQYHYDRNGIKLFGTPSPTEGKPIDLAKVDPTLVPRLVKQATGKVEKPTTRYLAVRRSSATPAVLWGYALAGGETGYVGATVDGKVVLRYPQ